MSNAQPSQPLFIFAHGAGAGQASDWMLDWKQRLGRIGTVVAFDYNYMALGRKAPDRLPKLLVRHKEVLAEARTTHPTCGPVILVGKSMGSRVGCHLSLEESIDGLICLGYPLRSLGKSKAVRDEVLVALQVPVLFCQGSKDPMGPLDLFAQVRERMSALSEIHVVEGGNHSLRVGVRALKAQGLTQDDVDEQTFAAIRGFVDGLKRS